MPTFGELKTRLQRWVIDSNTGLTAETSALVVKGWKEVQKRHNFHIMQAEVSATTSITTTVLASAPSNWKERRGDPWLVDASGNTTPISWAPSKNEMIKQFETSNTTTGTGQPAFILEAANSDEVSPPNLEVYPLPNVLSDYSDGNYRIVIPYWKYLSQPSDSADTDWLMQNVDWVILFHALAHAFWLNWDPENAALWEQKAEAELKKEKILEKKTRVSRSGILTPRRNVNANYNQKGFR